MLCVCTHNIVFVRVYCNTIFTYVNYIIHVFSNMCTVSSYSARGLTFAGNPRNSIRYCNLMCCFRVCVFFPYCERAKY